ncbi:MAG: DUF721 domain-containing protein [Spirochaetaceae bacterium]|nr:MAG: DUF721 domain-containing protein [Spirochaetaceae bacterium]
MEKAGNLLNSLLGHALSREAEKYSSFFHFFKDVLGEQLSRQILIRDIENHVVIAEASHPGWIQTFSMKKAEVLAKLTSRYPDLKIKDIHVKLARGKPGEPKAREKTPLLGKMERLSQVQQDKVVKQMFSPHKRRNLQE